MRCCGSDHRKRFDNFREINSIPTAAARHFHADIEERLADIRDEVSVDLPSDPGLYEGKMGRALWLLSYAAAYGDTISNNIAMKLIADIYNSLPVDDLGFASGISGIGWACLYLEQSGLISVPREVFESIDRHILPSWTLCPTYLLTRVQPVCLLISVPAPHHNPSEEKLTDIFLKSTRWLMKS